MYMLMLETPKVWAHTSQGCNSYLRVAARVFLVSIKVESPPFLVVSPDYPIFTSAKPSTQLLWSLKISTRYTLLVPVAFINLQERGGIGWLKGFNE